MFLNLFLLISIFSSTCFSEGYNGYRVLKVIPKNDFGLKRIKSMIDESKVALWNQKFGKEFDVMVSPEFYDSFIKEFQTLETTVYLLIKDVGREIKKQRIENVIARQKAGKLSPRIDNTFYRTLDEIYSELHKFENSYPDLMAIQTIGKTYEGRDLHLMKISSGTRREIIWIDCGIHAREWVSPASCLYFIDSLSTYGSDNEITNLLDKYNFYILTVGNPDGYDYTWSGTQERLWRKNRVPYNDCYGTDLNRNFDSKFGGAGSSGLPCADTYRGPYAFSEYETQAIRDTVEAAKGQIKFFFSLHAYSQLWMTPYGYTKQLPADYDEQYRVAGIGVEAVKNVYGTRYTYGSIANIIYEASGGSVDWTYDSANIIYSYAIELRDKGQYGFLLPANQIEPTATEIWEGIKAAINAAK